MLKITNLISTGEWTCASAPSIDDIGTVCVNVDGVCYYRNFSEVIDNKVNALESISPFEFDDAEYVYQANLVARNIATMVMNKGTINESLWTQY